jgi:hypothetical protein
MISLHLDFQTADIQPTSLITISKHVRHDMLPGNHAVNKT